MYFYTFQFVFVSCVLQFLGAAPNNGNLPFEVDVDSGNVGIDTGLGNTENGLTAQASKQGENFVESPKPADITQGFSFDSEPESSSKTKNKPTKTASATTTPSQKPILTTESTPANLPTTTTGAKQKRKPISELSASPALPTMNPAASMMNDPFFAYAMKEFMRQQQMLMSLLSSDFMGMGGPGSELGMMNPMFPFGGSSFQMPSMADMQQSLDVSNMELIEDRVIDDDKGKGHLQTYKSKDGTAVIQTVTYSTLGDDSVIPATPAEQIAAAPTAKSTRPRLSRAASSARAHSPRRVRVR